jgi:hypothetical protein
LAAGGFDDPEVTSCVLWLRSFGVDIACVEITPYRLPDNRIALVPRVIIPLPETKDYMVSAEEKEAEQAQQRKITEDDLLKMAGDREVTHLLSVCRQMRSQWKEGSSSVFGGSFVYSLTTEKGWRSLFGVNASGERKNTPSGQLEVWIPVKNLAELANQDAATVRSVLTQDHPLLAAEKTDFVMRLSNTGEASALVDRLTKWASSAAGSVAG